MTIMNEGRAIAEKVLAEHKDKLLEVVNYLNKHEVITEENLREILGEKQNEQLWNVTHLYIF